MGTEWSEAALVPYVGLPWRLHGSDRDGVDCWGLVRLVYREVLGIELPGYDDGYVEIADPRVPGIVTLEMDAWEPVELRMARPLDVVLFGFPLAPVHAGLLVDPGRFLHAPVRCTSRIDRLTIGWWWSHLEGVYRCSRRR